jgi:uncharacterized protein (TIGR02452 family)
MSQRLESIDRRAKNVSDFNSAQDFINKTPELMTAVSESIKHTVLYDSREVQHTEGTKQGLVKVFNTNTFNAASTLVKEGYSVAALNMASGVSPGGGVVRGSNAQEESLCRESTLYPCLNTEPLWVNYYKYHKSLDGAAYTDAVIYTPGIMVLRRPRFSVNIVSVAAPNLKRCTIDTKTSAGIIKTRVAKVMDICASKGDTAIVLGALGCGAFENDAVLVSSELKTLLFDEAYAKLFEKVYFAVLGVTDVGKKNYTVFRDTLNIE